MRARLLRSTPFRVALLLTGTFLGALVVAALVAQYLVRQELAARLDASLCDTFAVIGQSFGDNDIADLTASVESYAHGAAHQHQIFRLTDAGGRVLAGNLGPVALPDGWSSRTTKQLALPDRSDHFRLLVGQVGSNQLVIGSSLGEIDEVWQLVLVALAWAAAFFLALVLVVGGLVAAGAQRRLDGISATMHKVGQGDLAARIRLRGRDDDIDLLARNVNAALDRLAALVDGMRQVSVDIAHDLKTPLSRLAITIESAIEADRHRTPVADLLVQAQAESAQINATFEALLRIAQIEAGARRARFTAVPLAPVLETVVEIYGDLADERGQKLVMEPCPDPTQVEGDKELLTQLFANLVENSLRHGGQGGTVWLSCSVLGGQHVIIVADDGPGIPVQERERVFRRLYRLDKSRSTPGNGLGLSLAKAISDLHGAAISLDDNRPGLRVTIAFPPPVVH